MFCDADQGDTSVSPSSTHQSLSVNMYRLYSYYCCEYFSFVKSFVRYYSPQEELPGLFDHINKKKYAKPERQLLPRNLIPRDDLSWQPKNLICTHMLLIDRYIWK